MARKGWKDVKVSGALIVLQDHHGRVFESVPATDGVRQLPPPPPLQAQPPGKKRVRTGRA